MPVVDCDLRYTIDTSTVLIKGTGECDGDVVGLHYTVTDACGRSASCVQKVTLRIPLPEVQCPEDATVECDEDIKPGTPSVKTYCNQTYTITHAGPALSKGRPNCPGAAYTITYTVKDDCDRKVSCTQHFVINNAAPTIKCPPDRTVECKEDIREEMPQGEVACGGGDVTFDGPHLESGKDNCPNAVYTITYTIEDTCARSASCVQRWRLSGDDLVVKCPDDTIVRSKEDIVPSAVYATTSCDVEAYVEHDPPSDIRHGWQTRCSIYILLQNHRCR